MEEPLPAGGSCLLGSINLSEFIINPFTDKAYFDFNSFNNTVKQCVIALNEVLDEGLSLHPLEEQRESVANWRQIGLGNMADADCLIKLGIKYGNKESLKILDKIGYSMINSAIQQSALLAKEHGAYPMYNKEAVMSSSFFIQNTSEETKVLVEKYGLRNSQLLTIAPTGSLSTMLGVSGGIEPVYDISYTRKTESLHKKDEYYKVYTPIVAEYMKLKNIISEEDLPDIFVTAMNLNYRERIDVQSTWQTYIDASISSTVNVPEDFTIEDVENLYLYAYEKGLKGITIYRNNCARTGILTNNKSEDIEIQQDYIIPKLAMVRAKGERVKLPTGCGSIWLMTFKDKNNNLAEIFSQPGTSGGCQGLTEALTRTVSLLFRSGVHPDYIIDQLQSVKCPVAMNARKEGKCDGKSCSDIIAKELLYQLGKNKNTLKQSNNRTKCNSISSINSNKCPECGEVLRFEGGCVTCSNCGYSKCE